MSKRASSGWGRWRASSSDPRSRLTRNWAGVVAVGISILSVSADASNGVKRAAVCLAADSSQVFVDGMLDDWQGIAGHRLTTARDAGLTLRCTYDDRFLALSFNVRDDKIVRVPKGAVSGQDRVTIELSAGGRGLSLVVLPGNHVAAPRIVGGRRGIQVADSLQPQGFSVEALIPRKAVSGWQRSVPLLSARLAFHDVDSAVPGRVEEVLAVDGSLHFEAHWKTFREFLRTAQLTSSSLYFDELVDVDAGDGRERVVAGKTIVAVLSDRFAYFGLPVAHRNDVVELRTVDFDGGGRSALVAHLRQSQGVHSREIVGVWFVESGGQFRQALAFEVKREAPGRLLENLWVIEPRDPGRGAEIRVTIGEILGWNERSVAALDTSGARPLLTPWGPAQEVAYSFDGGALVVGAP